MATDYEIFYQDNRHGLGEPTNEFVSFFENYTETSSDVLDVGCGQGRDALFIARLGHRVTAIDLSPTGISELNADAEAEDLKITGVVGDVRHYDYSGKFDVIVIDRTLHMLNELERLDTLRKLLTLTSNGSHILIADERSNIPALVGIFKDSQWSWCTTLEDKGLLFMRRQ
jgi:2-polyprenyl-3-methyl-5-hydroxy-6-metoxy-1,4-benzoquinol methylase